MSQQNTQWLMKDHTAIKHKVLGEYLERWLAILGRPAADGSARTLHYIDTHAGRGRYEGGEVGSPIIAMQKGEELHRHKGGSVYLDCHNVESNNDNYESLVHEVDFARPACPSVDVSNYVGDFKEHIQAILRVIPAREAAIIFVDPFGYKDVVLREMLAYLKGRRFHELFVTFMSQFIARFMSDETKHETLDAVLDTDEWRAFIGVRDGEEKLVDLYAKRLQKVGSETTGQNVFAYPIKVRVPRGQSPYYLIHVSQHPKARVAMEAAVDTANSSRLLFSEALSLFTTVEIEEAIIHSATRQPGISALSIAGEVWREHLTATWRNDVRRTIQRFSQDGVLNIVDKDGNQRGVGVLPAEGDQIYATGRQPSETFLF